jgi:hypothetical protein
MAENEAHSTGHVRIHFSLWQPPFFSNSTVFYFLLNLGQNREIVTADDVGKLKKNGSPSG